MACRYTSHCCHADVDANAERQERERARFAGHIPLFPVKSPRCTFYSPFSSRRGIAAVTTAAGRSKTGPSCGRAHCQLPSRRIAEDSGAYLHDTSISWEGSRLDAAPLNLEALPCRNRGEEGPEGMRPTPQDSPTYAFPLSSPLRRDAWRGWPLSSFTTPPSCIR